MSYSMIIIVIMLILYMFVGSFSKKQLRNVAEKYQKMYEKKMMNVDIFCIVIGVIILVPTFMSFATPTMFDAIPILKLIFNPIVVYFIFAVELVIRATLAVRVKQLYATK